MNYTEKNNGTQANSIMSNSCHFKIFSAQRAKEIRNKTNESIDLRKQPHITRISLAPIATLLAIYLISGCATKTEEPPPGRRLVLGFRAPFIPPTSSLKSIAGYRVTISTPGRQSSDALPDGWEKDGYQNRWYVNRPWKDKDRLPTIYLPDSLLKTRNRPSDETSTIDSPVVSSPDDLDAEKISEKSPDEPTRSSVRDAFDVQILLYAADDKVIARGSRRNVRMPESANDDPEIMDLLITLTPNPALWNRTPLFSAPTQSEKNVSPWLSEFWFVFQGKFEKEDVSASIVTVEIPTYGEIDGKKEVFDLGERKKIDGEWRILARGDNFFDEQGNAPPSVETEDDFFDDISLFPVIVDEDAQEPGLNNLYLEPERSQTVISFRRYDSDCPLEPGIYTAQIRVRSELARTDFGFLIDESDEPPIPTSFPTNFPDDGFQKEPPSDFVADDDSFFTNPGGIATSPTPDNPNYEDVRPQDTDIDRDDSIVLTTLTFEIKAYSDTVKCRTQECQEDDDCKVRQSLPVATNIVSNLPESSEGKAPNNDDSLATSTVPVPEEIRCLKNRCVPRINSCEREICKNIEVCSGQIGNDEVAGLFLDTGPNEVGSTGSFFNDIKQDAFTCDKQDIHCNAINCNVGYICQNSVNSLNAGLGIRPV